MRRSTLLAIGVLALGAGIVAYLSMHDAAAPVVVTAAHPAAPAATAAPEAAPATRDETIAE